MGRVHRRTRGARGDGRRPSSNTRAGSSARASGSTTGRTSPDRIQQLAVVKAHAWRGLGERHAPARVGEVPGRRDSGRHRSPLTHEGRAGVRAPGDDVAAGTSAWGSDDPLASKQLRVAEPERWPRDSNPRGSCPPTRFPGVSLRPLGQATAVECTENGSGLGGARPQVRRIRVLPRRGEVHAVGQNHRPWPREYPYQSRATCSRGGRRRAAASCSAPCGSSGSASAGRFRHQENVATGRGLRGRVALRICLDQDAVGPQVDDHLTAQHARLAALWRTIVTASANCRDFAVSTMNLQAASSSRAPSITESRSLAPARDGKWGALRSEHPRRGTQATRRGRYDDVRGSVGPGARKRRWPEEGGHPRGRSRLNLRETY